MSLTLGAFNQKQPSSGTLFVEVRGGNQRVEEHEAHPWILTGPGQCQITSPQCTVQANESSKAATRGYKTRGRDQLEIKELAQPERRHDGIELSHEPNLEPVNYHTTILRPC